MATVAEPLPATALSLHPRADPERTPAVQLFVGISVLLVAGIGTAILTAPDHQWWYLYFSQLGTVAVFSGFSFNTTLLAAGILIFLLSRRVRQEMREHSARRRTHRRGPALVSGLIASLGLHLAVVGLVPINTVKPVHDLAALGITFSFLVLLIVTPIYVPGLRRRLVLKNVPTGILLVGGFVIMTCGVINLTLFEFIAFASMFLWLWLFFGHMAPARTTERAARRRLRRGLSIVAAAPVVTADAARTFVWSAVGAPAATSATYVVASPSASVPLRGSRVSSTAPDVVASEASTTALSAPVPAVPALLTSIPEPVAAVRAPVDAVPVVVAPVAAASSPVAAVGAAASVTPSSSCSTTATDDVVRLRSSASRMRLSRRVPGTPAMTRPPSRPSRSTPPAASRSPRLRAVLRSRAPSTRL